MEWGGSSTELARGFHLDPCTAALATAAQQIVPWARGRVSGWEWMVDREKGRWKLSHLQERGLIDQLSLQGTLRMMCSLSALPLLPSIMLTKQLQHAHKATCRVRATWLLFFMPQILGSAMQGIAIDSLACTPKTHGSHQAWMSTCLFWVPKH